MKTKLIFKNGDEDINWDGCDYSKAGRTDKGVSAFGQVIGLRVRSSRPKQCAPEASGDADVTKQSWDSIRDELPYPRLLNRTLPKNIRVLAWCPSPPPDFSARFSCRQRRYRYFFAQPASCPIAGQHGIRVRRVGLQEREGWLDIDAMRVAARKYIGSHDFRNFCKIDAEKQITNFERRIDHASIDEVPASSLGFTFVDREGFNPAFLPHPQGSSCVYSFTVWGSAFLWHQVRHMAAILFLVGQGLEAPEIVDHLLNVQKTPGKPLYDMADDHPLVLWDSVFPRDGSFEMRDHLQWILPDEQVEADDRKQAFHSSGDGRYGPGGINDCLWSSWYERKIEEVLAGQLVQQVALQQSNVGSQPAVPSYVQPQLGRIFGGGPMPKSKGEYVPVQKRGAHEAPNILNARWLGRQVPTAEAGGGSDRMSE